MPVRLEFLNIIIPIKSIEKAYKGGFEEFMRYHFYMVGGKVWYDDYLVRDGVMDPTYMKPIIENLERRGLKGIVLKDGIEQWQDFCVIDELAELDIPCSWLKLGDRFVAHVEDPSEKIVFRNDF